MDEDGRERLARLLRQQGRACADLGSPLYARLLDRAADDARTGGVVADVLAGYEDDPADAALALRLLGAVHRLVLDGRAPELAAYYPSAGGASGVGDPWPAFVGVLRESGEQVRRGLAQAPQTNEVGRAAALLGGLLHVAARTGLPVRLHEVGASAGLNLRADAFRVVADDDTAWGPPDAPVVLRDAWRGAPLPPVDAPLRIEERVGGDIAPLDPTTPEGELALLSYVWPDQSARIERLRGAVELARRVPARVVLASAAEFLAGLDLRSGAATVVWHSIVWQYLPDDERAAADARLGALAAQASVGAPFGHLSLEPRRPGHGEFVVTLTLAPDGGERVLGVAHPHGIPVTWRDG